MTTTLTRWGHSCVRLDGPGGALVIDPGSFSDVGSALRDVGAVLVTHEHPDHLDADAVVGAARTGAEIAGPEPVVAALLAAGAPSDRVRTVAPGDRVTAAGFTVDVLGGEHAVIHPDVPVIANLAYLVDGAVLHPGDSWTVPPSGTEVDVLLLPLGAPWLRVADAVDLVRAVAPRQVVGIHDAVLSDAGRRLAVDLVGRLGGSGPVTVLAPGESTQVLRHDRPPVLEEDQSDPPRPEEQVADVARSAPDPSGHGAGS